MRKAGFLAVVVACKAIFQPNPDLNEIYMAMFKLNTGLKER